MKLFNGRVVAAQVRTHFPNVTTCTVEVRDNDGAIVLYVRDKDGNPLVYHDSGATAEEDLHPLWRLAVKLTRYLRELGVDARLA